MLGGHAMVDAFEEIDTSDLCFSPQNHQWIPDLFEEVHEEPLSQDDLLTDAVSEIMKFRTDIPDLQLDEGVVLGDLLNEVPHVSENENLSVHSFGSNRASEESSGYVSCVMSSGTPSPTTSPHPKVESPNSHIHDVGRNVEITHLPVVKNEFEELRSTVNASQTHNLMSQRHLFRSHLNTSVSASNGRVHFIVRPGTSVSLAGKTKIGIDNPLYCNIRRLTPFNGIKNQSDMSEVKALNPNNKTSNFVHIMKTPGVRALAVSPGNTTSTSSSDSDVREGNDDVCMAPYAQFHVKASNQLGSDSTGRSSRFKSPIEFSHHYSQFNRSDSPAPRVSDVCPSFIETDADDSFLQQSKLSSTQSTCKGQVHSRPRSPMRVDRPDVSPSGVLILTDEEKRTLVTEGYSIPTRLPLSKQDERNLKKVRRKIKNKISAQESRRKKKEYLEALERKISIYSQENLDLKRRVDGLESTNRSLLGQLRLLQQLINKSKTSSASGGSNTVCSGTASAFSHHSDSSKSAYRTNGNNNSNVGTNSNSSHSNDAVIVGGGKGGSASTCLMVFALFFAALLVGKPPPTTSQQNSLGSGLIFAPPPQGLLDNLISHGPAGFVPGSLSQIGYTWSRRPVYGPYHNNRIRAPSWLNTNGTLPVRSVPLPSQPDVTVDCMRNTNWPCSTLTINQGYQTRSASKITLEPAPRSRLLGDPNELDECSAPPRTFWSFLFGSGGMTKSDEPDDADQVCGRSDPSCLWSEEDNSHVATEFELALDSVSLKQSSELVGLHVNKTTTTDTADSSASRSLETVATVPFLISVA